MKNNYQKQNYYTVYFQQFSVCFFRCKDDGDPRVIELVSSITPPYTIIVLITNAQGVGNTNLE
ncbi:hypothetical protein IG631_20053 [Alternaria alternata]|nr:hypothetical protein IG631_20053 [Alternaria alternata]